VKRRAPKQKDANEE
jgi:hypothetical protein